MSNEPLDQSDERRQNKRSAMRLAQDAAMQGDPICGAYFGFLSSIRHDQNAAFEEDFYDVDFEDDSDECRPY